MIEDAVSLPHEPDITPVSKLDTYVFSRNSTPIKLQACANDAHAFDGKIRADKVS